MIIYKLRFFIRF